MPNWKKVIVSGSDAILNSIDVNGTGSVDYLEVNDRLQGNGSGFQFFAYNEDTIKVKFANWYSSNDRQYGMGQLWYETWFAAIDNQAGRDNRRIGFYLEEPNAGSTDSGTPGQHPSNARFYVDINGAYLSGSLNVESSITGSDITIDNWGSVSASLSTLNSDIAGIDSSVTLQDATNNGNTTSNSIITSATLSGSAVHIESSGQKTVFATERIAASSTSTIVANITVSDHLGAIIEYTVYHDNPHEGMRTGQIMSVFESSGGIELTDNSTADIGDTSAVNFTATNNGTTARFTLNTPDADWNIRTLTRLL